MGVTGCWETHKHYGQQLRLVSTRTVQPTTIDGIQRYLSSDFVKGVGPKLIDSLVSHFKEDTLTVIENDPNRLSEVKGIGKKTAERIAHAWRNDHTIRSLIDFMRAIGLSPAYASRIYSVYGDDSLKVLHKDPYRLVHDLPRIGFSIADAVMQHGGMSPDDPQRVQACVLHTLRAATEDGNTYLPKMDMESRCRKAYNIESGPIEDAVQKLSAAEQIVLEDGLVSPPDQAVYLQALFGAESGIANRLQTLLSPPAQSYTIDRDYIAEKVLRHMAIDLSPDQTKVIANIFAYRVAIITGGPGTGKTTLIRAITAVFDSLGNNILLAAPTGRAARRLSELTRRKAQTIHKLLGYNPLENHFEHNIDNPLQTDVVIIDEASMVDTIMMNNLLRAIHVTSRLILVGDVFQLPSVGPGNVLADLIRSKVIQTFELTKIYRQSRESAIVLNAHRVRRGEPPEIPSIEVSEDVSDFYFFDEHQPEKVVKLVIDLCSNLIPARFGLDPNSDIQVLTPMHKGIVGTINLNRAIQLRLNQHTDAIRAAGQSFMTGDKVMHLKNNYHKDVYNGDSGIIDDIDLHNLIVSVDYDGRIVEYSQAELEDLSLAYAITVHKSQGSEYPAIIMPIMTQHYIMLQRNLLYTAITRGKQLVILVGSRKALGIALSNVQPRMRLSGLTKRLGSSE
jgi:exodeoxyribonuclease V alpha subunit